MRERYREFNPGPDSHSFGLGLSGFANESVAPRSIFMRVRRHRSFFSPLPLPGPFSRALSLHSPMKTKLTTIPASNPHADSEFRIRNYHVQIDWRGTCWVVDSARDILAHHERDRFIPVSNEHWQKVRISRLSRSGPPYRFLMQISSHSLVTLQEIAACYRGGQALLAGNHCGSDQIRFMANRWHASVARKVVGLVTGWRQRREKAQRSCAD